MRKFASVLVEALLFWSLVVGSAAAQPGYSGPAVWNLDARINEVQRGLDKGAADGAIDRREYDQETHRVQEVRRHVSEWRQAHGGQLDPAAAHRFEYDLDTIISQVHWIRQEWRRPW